MTTIPQQHLVTVISDRPPIVVTGMIATEDTPDIDGGRGGWQSIPRARRSALVEWSGPEAETYELALRLTEGATPNVDAAVRALDRMSRMPSETVAPPILRITGKIPAAGRRWAINSLALTETKRSASGAYESCIATLSLVIAENTGDGVVVGSRVPSVTRAVKGDTLIKIATRFYGNAKHAKDLGKAQKPVIHDIHVKIKPGRKIILP